MSGVARGFNRLAPIYDGLARAVFGNHLRKAQSVYLARIPKQSKILVLGGGSGWFLEELIRQTDPAAVFYLEISSKMIAASKARIQKNLPAFELGKITFFEGELAQMREEDDFDVICTHCFLDLFGPKKLEENMKSLHQKLRPNGLWYFSDFHIPQKYPMRVISSVLIKIMYLFFKWTCKIDAKQLPDFQSYFDAHQLKIGATTSFFGGMIVAKMYRKAEL